MPSTQYSFLQNTCPATATATATATFENLTFWTLGYGGWLGASILPIVWSLPVSKTLRTILSILALPTCAMIMTGLFSAFYLGSLFTYHMSVVMISPQFLHSCIGMVCLSVGSIVFFLVGSNSLKICIHKAPEDDEVAETNDEADNTDNEDSETNDENENTDNDNEDSESNNDTENTDDEAENTDNNDDNAWRETAHFEGLRSAAPLPE